MYEIWVVEESGKRALVRDDVVDSKHASDLVQVANHGAGLRGEPHRYEAVHVYSSAEAPQTGSQDKTGVTNE